jgi:hypothetical protein
MSACAVSLTERPCSTEPGAGFTSSAFAPPGTVRTAKEQFRVFWPARSRWIAPGRIEYMSTQRRENRFFSRPQCAAGDRTASPPLAGWPQLFAIGSPPQARSDSTSGTLPWVYPPQGSRRISVIGSSYPPIFSPSGLTRLHLTLPQVPAAKNCRTERYDGKGNLHLQHAA